MTTFAPKLTRAQHAELRLLAQRSQTTFGSSRVGVQMRLRDLGLARFTDREGRTTSNQMADWCEITGEGRAVLRNGGKLGPSPLDTGEGPAVNEPNHSWKPKVTYEVADIVYVRILGEQRPGTSFPTLPADEGVVERFMKWCTKNEIVRVIPGHSGGGSFTGGFFRGDAEKVLDWLDENSIPRSRTFRGYPMDEMEDAEVET